MSIDRAGRPIADQSWRKGRPPANKGKRLPVQAPRQPDVLRAVETLGDSPQDLRLAALIALIWRGGLALVEALEITHADLDADLGVLLVQRGGKFAKREARMDKWGFQRLDAWLAVRDQLPDGPLLCVLRGPTAGQRWSEAGARIDLQRVGSTVNVKLSPRSLRHAHVVELAERGVPLSQINQQLGTHGESHRHSRVPAALSAVTGASASLNPPGAEEALRRSGHPDDAYSWVRRAAQSADAAYRQAQSRAAKRAWSEALQALHDAEESIMHASAEDFGGGA